MEKTVQQLYDERGKVFSAMEDLSRRIKEEGRKAMTSDESAEFQRMNAEFEKLTADIGAAEDYKGVESRMNEIRTLFDADAKRSKSTPPARGRDGKINEEARELAFDAYARRGVSSLTEDERAAIEFVKMTERANTTAPDSAGGYLVPNKYADMIYMYMSYFGGPLEAGKIIKTSSGNPWELPKIDDTGNPGAIIAEGVADSFVDLTIGQTVLGAYTITSKGLKLSYELLEDDGFDVLAYIAEILGTRIGRKLSALLTTGNGTTEPQGIVTGSTLGRTATGASAITRTDIMNLKGSVNYAYQRGPKVGFMFNQSTLTALQLLTIGAGDDRPLWQPSMREGEPDRLEGVPYWINNDMANIGTTNKSVLYGDFSQYWIRQVKGIVLQRAAERYIEERVVAFFAHGRYDAKVINTGAIKHLVHP